MLSTIRYHLLKIKRYLSYGKLGLETNDHESKYWITFLRFKLKSSYKEILNKDSVKSYEELKSLRICIKLSDRIQNNFHRLNLKKHYQIWGETIFEYMPVSTENGIVYTLVDKNRYLLNQEQTLHEERSLLDALKLDEEHKERDTKLLFRILFLYFNTWHES